MKTKLFVLIFLIVGFISCQQENITITKDYTALIDTVTFSPSMKGWELYSWFDGNGWTYSILTGTNRAKSVDEVTTNTIKVVGKEPLKLLLAKIPANEYISWAGNKWLSKPNGDRFNLKLPDAYTVNEIKDFCAQKGLVLYVGN